MPPEPLGAQELAAAAPEVARVAAARLGLPKPELVRVGSSAVFRCGQAALRVDGPEVNTEAAVQLSRFLDGAGIPVPVALADPTEIEGWQVTTWPWLEKSTAQVDGQELGSLLAQVHAIDPIVVQKVANIPSWSELPLIDLGPTLVEISERSLLPASQLERLQSAYVRHRDWEHRTEAPPVICHGDLHLNNVVVNDKGLWLIDWGAVCVAPACWDHAMFTTLDLWGGSPGFYGAFSRGYGRDYSNDRGCSDLAAMRLLSATANLVLKIAAGRARSPATRSPFALLDGRHRSGSLGRCLVGMESAHDGAEPPRRKAPPGTGPAPIPPPPDPLGDKG